jgi:hypothetical protein
MSSNLSRNGLSTALKLAIKQGLVSIRRQVLQVLH